VYVKRGLKHYAVLNEVLLSFLVFMKISGCRNWESVPEEWIVFYFA